MVEFGVGGPSAAAGEPAVDVPGADVVGGAVGDDRPRKVT